LSHDRTSVLMKFKSSCDAAAS